MRDEPGIRWGPDADTDAAEWLVRMTSGDVREADLLAFAKWVENPDNAEAYAEAELLWEALGEGLQRKSNVVALRPRVSRFAWLDRRAMAMAASFALAFICASQYAAVWQYDHATQGASTEAVVLEDGSRVALNTGSAIDYEFKDGVRHVHLAKGEAFFDVKRDVAHPFVIDAGGAEVRVLGTAFSVRRDEDGGEVIVQRGKVRVSTATGSVDLLPDQKVDYSAGRMQGVAAADAGSALAWSRGRLIFQDKPLGEVIDALDRYHAGVIIFSNDKAAKARVNAVVEIDRIDDWLAALQRSHDVTVRVLPGVTLVS